MPLSSFFLIHLTVFQRKKFFFLWSSLAPSRAQVHKRMYTSSAVILTTVVTFPPLPAIAFLNCFHCPLPNFCRQGWYSSKIISDLLHARLFVEFISRSNLSDSFQILFRFFFFWSSVRTPQFLFTQFVYTISDLYIPFSPYLFNFRPEFDWLLNDFFIRSSYPWVLKVLTCLTALPAFHLFAIILFCCST